MSNKDEPKVLPHFMDEESLKTWILAAELLDNGPTYPSTFFLDNGHKRPIVSLKNKLSTLGSLRGLIKSNIASKSVTSEMASQFIYLFTKKNFHSKCRTDWKSFGVEIAKKGVSVTIDSIIEIKEGTEDLDGLTTTSLDEDAEDVGIMMYLISMFRICSTKRGDYREKIIKKAVDHMMSLCYTPDSVSEAAIAYEPWLMSESYCKLIAAIDMYLINVGNKSIFQRFRFGTIPSRHKDCSVLLTLQMISDHCGYKSISELDSWLFFRRLSEALKRIIKDNEEITKADSYMPYSSGFKLFTKSPYSAASNPEFATFLHVAASFMGFDRSQNAILPEFLYHDKYTSCYNGLILAFANRKKHIKVKTGKRSVNPALNEQEVSISGDSLMECETPEDFIAWLRKNGVVISPGLAEFMKIRKKDFTNARPGTVAAYLLNSFP